MIKHMTSAACADVLRCNSERARVQPGALFTDSVLFHRLRYYLGQTSTSLCPSFFTFKLVKSLPPSVAVEERCLVHGIIVTGRLSPTPLLP